MSQEEHVFSNISVGEMRVALDRPLAYLQLVYSFTGQIVSPECRRFLEETGRWAQHAGEGEIRSRGPALLEKFEKMLQEAFDRIPPRRPWREIAEDYWLLCKDKPFSWNKGLSHAWVAERFDTKALGIWQDLPLHGRVGIGHHAGTAAVEEEFLLRDAFSLLVRGRRGENTLHLLAEKAKQLTDHSAAMRQLKALNQSICRDSRLAVFSFYAFVECFVNSVGEDFACRNPGLPARDQELLRGSKKGRYLSTEKKIEKFAEIVRGDGSKPLILTDPKQKKEPFTTFVKHVKELRDAAAHFAKAKAAIWLSPGDWVGLANQACDTCMEVARQFWQACYPGRPMPDYLGWLEMERHVKIAEEQLAAEHDDAWIQCVKGQI